MRRIQAADLSIGVRGLCCALLFAGLTACGGSSRPSGGTGSGSDDALAFGLDRRPSNPTCVAPSLGGAGAAAIALAPAFPRLPPLTQPLGMLQAPGDDSRWFVLEKTGRVRVFANDPEVTAFDSDFIELTVNSASEGGLLGMAFHPDFESNGWAFLSWTEGSPMVSVIARFASLDGGQTLDPGSRSDILRLNQDFQNHNGGQIAFGSDGYLYIGFGDGGSGGDPNGRGQDTTNLLGALLRIDVDGGSPYAIPPDNPFAGGPHCGADPNVSAGSCPEIYAWGLRNPWRWSFDRDTGELWLGDVGQNAWEEVDRIQRGGNYGWDCREGTNPFSGASASCATATSLIDPVYQYAHTDGNVSITGGFVYRGTAIPELLGQYVFGDFGSGRIWRLLPDGVGGYVAELLLDTTLSIASFAEDADGELYVVDLGGTLHRIVASGSGGGTGPADRLSATGCVDPDNPAAPAPGLIPYAVAVPFWSDGAEKARWLAIPDGETISIGADGDFAFPAGTVLMKHFRLQGTLIETRLFMRHPDGEWAGYSYEWDDQGSDALLVQGGKRVDVNGQEWIFPSSNECMSCHTAAAGFSLGLETAQLNGEFRYAATERTANQLKTLDRIALFESPIGDVSVLPAMPRSTDATESIGQRARGYLHSNCAHCHRPNGPTPSDLDLRFSTALADTQACEVMPVSGDLGLTNARIVAPGAPERSVLLERLRRRDAHGMPPLASVLIDDAGVALIEAWIASLTGCT